MINDNTLQQVLSGENFLEKERKISEMILQLQIVRQQLLSSQQKTELEVKPDETLKIEAMKNTDQKQDQDQGQGQGQSEREREREHLDQDHKEHCDIKKPVSGLKISSLVSCYQLNP